ncbi:MAG TPA: hypothetical protein VIF33_04540, partial [Casimicrobiaceae bacterium]
MRNDATHQAAPDQALLDRESLEPQPVPRTDAGIAFARAGIRPVAGIALDSVRAMASTERPTSNAPFYVGVRGKFAFALLTSGAWFALTALIALPWIAQ